MNKRERAALKAECRAQEARADRIAEIKEGKIAAPAEYNDPLAARKKALKAAPESTFEVVTPSSYQNSINDGEREISKV